MNMGTFGDIPDQDAIEYWPVSEIQAWRGFPAYILLIMVSSAWLCYAFGKTMNYFDQSKRSNCFFFRIGKFACKVNLQGFSFAMPLTMVVPCTIAFLLSLCHFRTTEQCFMDSVMPTYMFWNCPEPGFLDEFLSCQVIK